MNEKLLYTYLLEDWSNNTYLVLFHIDQFTKNEFEKMCNAVFEKLNKNNDIYPDVVDFTRLFIAEYGFQYGEVLSYDVKNNEVEII